MKGVAGLFSKLQRFWLCHLLLLFCFSYQGKNIDFLCPKSVPNLFILALGPELQVAIKYSGRYPASQAGQSVMRLWDWFRSKDFCEEVKFTLSRPRPSSQLCSFWTLSVSVSYILIECGTASSFLTSRSESCLLRLAEFLSEADPFDLMEQSPYPWSRLLYQKWKITLRVFFVTLSWLVDSNIANWLT